METRTTAGRLFETDTRLRPDGASGLLVTSLAAFKDYQEKRAWLWEHQALTRARFCAGDAAIGKAFEEERKLILTQPREHDKLIEEVNGMRKKMHDGHPNKSALFDLKHDAGGMVDIEFCVQSLVLEHARKFAPLIENKGNIALLLRAASAGLIAPDIAEGAANAYRAYRKHQHALRLNNQEYARLPKEQVSEEIAVVLALRKSVLGQ
jgi:[glutamine synthetase] adenylyltransferase / [glutamine synthetase]-adenylyl-L-tyrosine phosphorylase